MAAKQGLTAHISQASEDAKRAVLSRAPTAIKSHSWLSNLNTTCTIKSAPPRTPGVMTMLSVKSGWLVKRNEQHVWQRRWCCVVPHTFLYYFEAEPLMEEGDEPVDAPGSGPDGAAGGGGGTARSGGGGGHSGAVENQDALNAAVRDGYSDRRGRGGASYYTGLVVPPYNAYGSPSERRPGNNGDEGPDALVESTRGPTADRGANLQPVGIIDLECYTNVNRSSRNDCVMELTGDAITNPDLRSFYFQAASTEDAEAWTTALVSDRHSALRDEREAYRQVCASFQMQLQQCSDMIDTAEERAAEAEKELYRVRSTAEEGRRRALELVREVLERRLTGGGQGGPQDKPDDCLSDVSSGVFSGVGSAVGSGSGSRRSRHSGVGGNRHRRNRTPDPPDPRTEKLERKRRDYAAELDEILRSPEVAGAMNGGLLPAARLLADYASAVMASHADLRQEIESLERRLGQSAGIDKAELTELKSQLEETERDRESDRLQHEEQVAVLEAELDSVRAALADGENQLQTSRMEFSMFQSQAKAKMTEVAQHKKILKKEVIDLRKRVDEIGSERDAAEHRIDNLRRDIDTERERNSVLERYIEKMENQVRLQQNMMEMMSQTASMQGGSLMGKFIGPGDGSCRGSDAGGGFRGQSSPLASPRCSEMRLTPTPHFPQQQQQFPPRRAAAAQGRSTDEASQGQSTLATEEMSAFQKRRERAQERNDGHNRPTSSYGADENFQETIAAVAPGHNRSFSSSDVFPPALLNPGGVGDFRDNHDKYRVETEDDSGSGVRRSGECDSDSREGRPEGHDLEVDPKLVEQTAHPPPVETDGGGEARIRAHSPSEEVGGDAESRREDEDAVVDSPAPRPSSPLSPPETAISAADSPLSMSASSRRAMTPHVAGRPNGSPHGRPLSPVSQGGSTADLTSPPPPPPPPGSQPPPPPPPGSPPPASPGGGTPRTETRAAASPPPPPPSPGSASDGSDRAPSPALRGTRPGLLLVPLSRSGSPTIDHPPLSPESSSKSLDPAHFVPDLSGEAHVPPPPPLFEDEGEAKNRKLENKYVDGDLSDCERRSKTTGSGSFAGSDEASSTSGGGSSSGELSSRDSVSAHGDIANESGGDGAFRDTSEISGGGADIGQTDDSGNASETDDDPATKAMEILAENKRTMERHQEDRPSRPLSPQPIAEARGVAEAQAAAAAAAKGQVAAVAAAEARPAVLAAAEAEAQSAAWEAAAERAAAEARDVAQEAAEARAAAEAQDAARTAAEARDVAREAAEARPAAREAAETQDAARTAAKARDVTWAAAEAQDAARSASEAQVTAKAAAEAQVTAKAAAEAQVAAKAAAEVADAVKVTDSHFDKRMRKYQRAIASTRRVGRRYHFGSKSMPSANKGNEGETHEEPSPGELGVSQRETREEPPPREEGVSPREGGVSPTIFSNGTKAADTTGDDLLPNRGEVEDQLRSLSDRRRPQPGTDGEAAMSPRGQIVPSENNGTGLGMDDDDYDGKSHISELTEDRTYKESFQGPQVVTDRSNETGTVNPRNGGEGGGVRIKDRQEAQPNERAEEQEDGRCQSPIDAQYPPKFIIGASPEPAGVGIASQPQDQGRDHGRPPSSQLSLPPPTTPSSLSAPCKGGDDGGSVSAASLGTGRLGVAQRARMEAEAGCSAGNAVIVRTNAVDLPANHRTPSRGPSPAPSRGPSPARSRRSAGSGGGFFSSLGKKLVDAIDGSAISVDSGRGSNGAGSAAQINTPLHIRQKMQREKQLAFLKEQGLIQDESSVRGGAGGGTPVPSSPKRRGSFGSFAAKGDSMASASVSLSSGRR